MRRTYPEVHEGCLENGAEAMGIERDLPLIILVHIHTLRTYINYKPCCCFTPRILTFGYHNPSVRLSSQATRVVRVESWASGSFAAKSEQTYAPVSFRCRNFAPYSGGTVARQGSKTLKYPGKRHSVTFSIGGVGPAATG